jgi:hypothetical protein
MEEPAVIREKLRLKQKEIRMKADKEYSDFFLKELNIKIGDIVPCFFNVNTGTRKQSYSSTKTADGIIKMSEDGIAFVESLEKLPISYNKSNNRTGRDYRSWWVYEYENVTASIGHILIEELILK